MSVIIGHSSIDENGNISGGKAGDQTKTEVCTRTWYNKGWTVLLRPKDSKLAEQSALACEKGCANDNIGYDQWQRNTLYTQAKAVNFDLSKITTACECDCSSFMTVCAIAGGANITYGSNAPTTSTMQSKFTASGQYEALTDSKYLTSDEYLKRGDILVKAGTHTVMVLSNGSSVSETVVNIPDVKYAAYLQSTGMQATVSNGATAGTTGEARRMEGIVIDSELPLEYCGHLQSAGWTDWMGNGSYCGTMLIAHRLEAVKIRLKDSSKYSVTYRVHVQSNGWTSWVKDGEIAGTTGQSKRLEAIEIKIISK